MPSVIEKPLVFDTSLYKDVPIHLRKAVMAEDLAGFFLEAGAIKLEERINPRELMIVNGRVFDPIRQEEINSRWQSETELSAIESNGAERFYSYVLQGYPTLLISGPHGKSPYLETRINIAHKVGDSTIHFYGIPSLFDQNACFVLANQINEFSFGEFNPKTIDDLRETPIPINTNNPDLWDFLNRIALLDSNAWEDIKTGNPWIRKETARQRTNEVVDNSEPMISTARTNFDHIKAGAYMEMFMQRQTGWGLNKLSCPGALNSELLATYVQIFGYPKDVFGNIRISESKFVKKCGSCGKEINDYISKGYQCSCGDIYQGC